MNSTDKQVSVVDRSSARDAGPGISDQHAALLEWYFGEGRATFGRSTCGGIIDRLKMFAFGSEKCSSCRGTGFRGGWSYGDTSKRKSSAAELAALLEIDTDKRDQADARCVFCSGSGVIARTTARRATAPITARPRASTEKGGGYTPSDYALQHYAIACRRLDLVHRWDPKAAMVLEAFHGDWGARWADTTQGRLFAVYGLTPAGHKLLRMSREKASLEGDGMRPDEVLGVEFELQRSQPKRQRADLFTAARDQAKRLLEQAWRSWNACEPQQDSERRQRREAKRKTRQRAFLVELLCSVDMQEADEINLEPRAPTDPRVAPRLVDEVADATVDP